MDVYIQQNNGNKKVVLTDKNFIAEGGEGKVYGVGDKIYKIYIDPKKMIPIRKIDELKILSSEYIINPLDPVMDSHGTPIGYYMKWIKDTVPLCKLFTNDFRNRFNIQDEQVISLSEKISKTIGTKIHPNKILLVDGNEMNYLVSKDFSNPYFIDVDSWQTPSFSATAIMASIRDHHSSVFSELSDWFSFAVIATQLFVGIHPYKGTHPNFKKSDMEGRMKANISIFNKDVKLPSAARPIDSIPSHMKDWLFRVLEKGERLAPPDKVGAIIAIMKHTTIASSAKFIVDLIQELERNIIRYSNGYTITENKIIYPNKREKSIDNKSMDIIMSNTGSIIFNSIDNGMLILEDDKSFKHNSFMAEDKMVYKNSLFIKLVDKVMQIEIQEFNNSLFPKIVNTLSVLPNSTTLYNGFIYQNILGTSWFTIPFVSNNKVALSQKMIPELKGYQVLEAKHENGIVVVIATDNKKYDEFIFQFDNTYMKYTCIKNEDVSYHIPNLIAMSNGVCVSITPDDEIRMFKNVNKIQVTSDPAITFDMKLCYHINDVYLRKENKLYRFKSK